MPIELAENAMLPYAIACGRDESRKQVLRPDGATRRFA